LCAEPQSPTTSDHAPQSAGQSIAPLRRSRIRRGHYVAALTSARSFSLFTSGLLRPIVPPATCLLETGGALQTTVVRSSAYLSRSASLKASTSRGSRASTRWRSMFRPRLEDSQKYDKDHRKQLMRSSQRPMKARRSTHSLPLHNSHARREPSLHGVVLQRASLRTAQYEPYGETGPSPRLFQVVPPRQI